MSRKSAGIAFAIYVESMRYRELRRIKIGDCVTNTKYLEHWQCITPIVHVVDDHWVILDLDNAARSNGTYRRPFLVRIAHMSGQATTILDSTLLDIFRLMS